MPDPRRNWNREKEAAPVPPFSGLGVSLGACGKAAETMTVKAVCSPVRRSFPERYAKRDRYVGFSGYEMHLALGREIRGR